MSTFEEYDLTGTVASFLDAHLMFPLLDFTEKMVKDGALKYDGINEARLALLKQTKMVDYAIEKGAKLDAAEKDKVVKEGSDLKEKCSALLKLREGKAKLMASGQWSVSGLAQADSSITSDTIEAFRHYARFQFDCGDYRNAGDLLSDYISIFAQAPTDAEDEDLIEAGITQARNDQNLGNANMYYLVSVDAEMLRSLWGKLACEILAMNWDSAKIAVNAVRTALDSMASSSQLPPLEALQQRTWLLHWSLFVYWNCQYGLESLIDLFLSEKYKQALLHVPHLLRYLTAAILISKRRKVSERRTLRQLTNLMNDCEYRDPVIDFIEQLCVKFDFEQAQKMLLLCGDVLKIDFFLTGQRDLFIEEARVFMFDNYCRIHHKISLSDLGEKLAMDPSDAEKWMTDLIRQTDLDAKIDDGCVVIGASVPSVYEQVMERTTSLNVRAATINQSLASKLQEWHKEKKRQEEALREDD